MPFLSQLGWVVRLGPPPPAAPPSGHTSSAGCLQKPSPFSVPIPLSISISITIEFSPFYLSNQHRTCLSPPLSTPLLLCLLQPGARGYSLSGNYDSLPGSCRKSLFFSLNVQVNFYRLFIQPLYWRACYLTQETKPRRERAGTRSSTLGQEGKTLQRVRG